MDNLNNQLELSTAVLFIYIFYFLRITILKYFSEQYLVFINLSLLNPYIMNMNN